ncbi:papain-like cysteine protease family protein [Aquimarina sediminis]|uniref:papain-like cysteine protease family protein n=1 Tax=Aquimarina sediminis TaxID=2070536 RepID=UPI000CA00077|nr:papain-like cysteine protease family protein [Aquimarina sediminis]
MKIFIDSNEAKKSTLGEFYRAPKIKGSDVWLPIDINKQLKSRWCWAAIASAVGNYYQTCTIKQKSLVKKILRDVDYDQSKYTESEIQEKNINFKLDIALKFVGSFSHWTLGKPIFERIQFEINQGRPLGVRLEWFKGGAHYILVKGYNAEEGNLIIEDSLHGSSIQLYDTFPEKYREGGAVWTETFWTNKLTTK